MPTPTPSWARAAGVTETNDPAIVAAATKAATDFFISFALLEVAR
jgi:hypothetical protein